MKRLVYLAFSLCLFLSSSFAQEKSDTLSLKNEISFSVDNTYHGAIDLTYSHKLFKNIWIESGISFSAYSTITKPIVSITYPSNNSAYYVGAMLGFLKYSTVKDLEMVLGFDLKYINEIQRLKIDNPQLTEKERIEWTQRDYYGIGLTFGAYYKLSESFLIGSTLQPNIVYRKDTDNEYFNQYEVVYNLAQISIIDLKYRF